MITDLAFQNPWWENPQRINEDKQIKDFRQSKLHFTFPLLEDFELEEDFIYTLRGPRQVGKTTLLKLLIKRLLEGGASPQSVFFYSLDLVENPKELFEIYKRFHDFSKERKAIRNYIFLDEVSLVPDWQYALKEIIDLGWGEKTVFIITGSSAIDLRRGAERLPGRRGKGVGLDKVLLPLSYQNVLKILEPDLAKNLEFRQLVEEIGKLDNLNRLIAEDFKIYYPRIHSVFEKYLMVGGFPPALESYLRHGEVEPHVVETYLTVLRSDFEKIKRSRVILKQVLRRLYETSQTSVSWQGLAKSVDVPSYKTVREYVDILADGFLVGILYFLDRNKLVSRPGKGKKFHFIDPLIYKIVAEESGQWTIKNILTDSVMSGKVVEGVVAAHLLRNFEERLNEGLGFLENVFYWKTARGNEVDFVALKNKTVLPIEVRYQESVRKANMVTIKKSFGQGIVATKQDFFKSEKVWAIPVSILLLWM